MNATPSVSSTGTEVSTRLIVVVYRFASFHRVSDRIITVIITIVQPTQTTVVVAMQ